VHAPQAQHVEHGRHVIGQRPRRVIAGDRIAAAVAAHVEAQNAEPSFDERRQLLGPAAAVRGERMGDADDRILRAADEVIIKTATGERQQHRSPLRSRPGTLLPAVQGSMIGTPAKSGWARKRTA
jgi:hypothetical protein